MAEEKKSVDLEGVHVQDDGSKGDGKKPKIHIEMPRLPKALSFQEKSYLLSVERGDTPNVRRILQKAYQKKHIDIDCMDSMGRGALHMAIDNENLEMVELLIVMGVSTKDSLLHAINEEFVEAVDLLLQHEELIHKEGEPHSWEEVDRTTATFALDITPLALAAHRNNFEIIKILLDRGATLPMPHDTKCGCDECIEATREDSLRHSLARVNSYRALASPSLIALSSNDPILTAFELSWELRNLAVTEQECKSEYLELRRQCQMFAVDLLSHTRGSKELAIILNHDPDAPPYEDGEHMKLARLELAIDYKQKKFVAHPNIQQLLAALWYEGVPGFRRLTACRKLMEILKVAVLFPVYCMLYMIAPNCKTSKLMRKPFMKFLIHASSYLFFLLLLILVSQRAEVLFIQIFGTDNMKAILTEQLKQQRGNSPTILEVAVVLYVIGFICEETREIVREGIGSYLRNMWNIIDFTRNSLYTAVIMLRTVAYLQQRREIMKDPALAFIPREHWDDFDPQLIAEGLFAAANVFSALKLVHLFSINPHLGPLQISLGRMVIDIVKFFFIYSLVLFAFACGLNQLLWYFADLEKKKCYHLPGGRADWVNNGDACMKWRRFGNLFESSQSLFWASFGMVGLDAFELTGIKSYTRFWGLLMFGSYSVINVIVLLNLLIAMMSNSYAAIVEHSDVEWKFARTRLWLSYFEESATLPPPFNIFPAPKHILKWLGMRKKDKIRRWSTRRKDRVEQERDYRYTAVMRALVWRYVAAMHRKLEDNPVTEDDINEIKSVINSMRCDIIEVLGKNGMDISEAETKGKVVMGKKMRVWERRLMKDFQVSPVAGEETVEELQIQAPENEEPLSRFRRLAKLAVLQSSSHKWGEVMRSVCQSSQIGRSCNRETFRNQQYLQRAMEEAQLLKDLKPKRGHSPTPSPIPIIDPTRDGILTLIKEIREEVNPGEKWRPPSSASDNNLLSVSVKSRVPSPRPGGQGLSGFAGSSSLAEAVAHKRAEAAKEGRDLKSTLLATRDPSPTTRVVRGLQNTAPDEGPKVQFDQKQKTSRHSEQRVDDPVPLPSRQDSTSAHKVIKRKQQAAQTPPSPKSKHSTDNIAVPRPRAENDLRQNAAPSRPTEPHPCTTKQEEVAPHPNRNEQKQPVTEKSQQTDVKPKPAEETKPSEAEKKLPAPKLPETKAAAPKVPSEKPLKPEVKLDNKLGEKSKQELMPMLQVTECTPIVQPKFGSTDKLIPKNDISETPEPCNLKPAQKVEGVATIKRQPKSGWL